MQRYTTWHKTFLGIPITVLTWIFFTVVVVLGAVAFTIPAVSGLAIVALIVILLAAILFSIYRSVVSLILFHRLPFSSFLLGGIAVMGLYVVTRLSPQLIPELFTQYKIFFVFLHLVGVALGVGGATISDIFFFRFLADLRISKWESKILHVLSEVIWAALALFWVSGIGLFLTNVSGYLNSSKFITKMIIIGVIMLNGLVLNYYISPRLATINFKKMHKHVPGELRQFRKMAFAFGAISLTSWYAALVLGMLRSIPISVPAALVVYGVVVLCAVGISQVVEQTMHNQGSGTR